MANFRTVADIADSVLQRCGEVTNGNSAYESRVLEHINRIHQTIIAGGNEFDIDIDEVWDWAREKHPIILELEPKFNTGTVSVTNGSEVATLSTSPSASYTGWHLKLDNQDEIYKVISHTGGTDTLELDSDFVGTTNATANFKLFKLDYEVVPSVIYVEGDAARRTIDFEETSGTELNSVLNAGTYTPSELATEIKTRMDAVGASTYTVTYDSTTRKFTVVSDLVGGGGIFTLLFGTGTNAGSYRVADLLGFNDADKSTAATQVSDSPIFSIAKLIEPVQIFNPKQARYMHQYNIYGVDPLSFQKEGYLSRTSENVPDRFTVLNHFPDGRLVIRFNDYPKETMRVALDTISIPKDVSDTSASLLRVPRSAVDVVEFGATFHILAEKTDDKAQTYFQLAQQKLKAMVANNRAKNFRIGRNFGQVIPRKDLAHRRRDRLIYGVPEES